MQSTKDNISKVYIEPTSRCNLNCKMCPRNVWTDEILGDMDLTLFNSLIDQVHKIKSIQTIFFSGIAEPLSHPDIAAMISKAKTPAVKVEMISNGSMLNEEIIEKLLLAGLDTLWISIDSAHHDSQEDLAGLDGFGKAKSNLLAFNLLRRKINPAAELGIAFVAMKSNISDLPEVIDLAAVFGVSELKISNVIPYTKDMQEEMLYRKSLSLMGFRDDIVQQRTPLINMPIMDFDLVPEKVLKSILRPGKTVKLGEHLVERKAGHCKFIDDGAVFVRWDGEVSPCMAMLHNNTTYLNNIERNIKFCSFGNIKNARLSAIWQSEAYKKFRSTINNFDFSPCTMCGACSYVDDNMEDCFGNLFPTCGGCLWAEGFAQCP